MTALILTASQDIDMRQRHEQYKLIQTLIKEKGKVIDEMKKLIIAEYLGKHSSIVSPNGLVLFTYNAEIHTAFDKERFELENPELVEQYRIETERYKEPKEIRKFVPK